MTRATPRSPRADVVETLSLTELMVFCDTNAEWVVTLVDHGVVSPVRRSGAEWEFTPAHIARARKASRLMRDLGLNVAGVALVLDLIDERDALARKLATLEVSQ